MQVEELTQEATEHYCLSVARQVVELVEQYKLANYWLTMHVSGGHCEATVGVTSREDFLRIAEGRECRTEFKNLHIHYETRVGSLQVACCYEVR